MKGDDIFDGMTLYLARNDNCFIQVNSDFERNAWHNITPYFIFNKGEVEQDGFRVFYGEATQFGYPQECGEGIYVEADWEILYGSQNVASKIRSGEHYTLPSIIAASASEGMMLMDDCLAELVKSGFVTQEDVARYASNPARMG